MATYLPISIGSAGWIWFHGGWGWLLERTLGDAPPRDLLIGGLVGLAVVGGSRLASARWARLRRMERVLAEITGPITAPTALALALASAIGEELLFRGVLQPWVGLVPAALLFAAAHVPVRRELALWPTFALLMGLALGGMMSWTGALLAPVTCHAVINFLNLRRLGLLARELDDQDDFGEGFFQ